MSKQKSNNKTPKSWNLARKGTGVWLPGIPMTPYPEWLSQTFFNVNVVMEDPLELREQLFAAGYDLAAAWGIVRNMLYAIHENATQDLGPLQIDESRPDEYEFLAQCSARKLIPRQANAVAALRSVALIRSQYFFLDKNGYYHPRRNANVRTAKMLLEMMVLTMSAIRGELWENIFPRTERGEQMSKGPKHRRERTVNLNREIKDALQKIGVNEKYRAVWQYLKKHRLGRGAITKMDQWQLTWINQNGQPATVERQEFQKRLSRVKTKLRAATSK